MSVVKKTLLLVGSPKYAGSSSESLGTYLLEQLSEKGIVTENIHINQLLKKTNGEEELLNAVNNCGLLILSFPLYVDSLPSGTIKALEIIAQDRAQNRNVKENSKQQFMLAICQSGFPEAHQSNIALAICRCFAGEAGFTWAGGLALGGGGALIRKSLMPGWIYLFMGNLVWRMQARKNGASSVKK